MDLRTACALSLLGGVPAAPSQSLYNTEGPAAPGTHLPPQRRKRAGTRMGTCQRLAARRLRTAEPRTEGQRLGTGSGRRLRAADAEGTAWGTAGSSLECRGGGNVCRLGEVWGHRPQRPLVPMAWRPSEQRQAVSRHCRPAGQEGGGGSERCHRGQRRGRGGSRCPETGQRTRR